MGASATLVDSAILTVAPGGEASCEVRVRNTGTVVDQFSFQVLGDAAPWAVIEPTTLSLFPEDEDVVRVRFNPPRRSSTRAGYVPFGVKVDSKEDPEGSVVAESALEIASFSELGADLVPRTSRGRYGGLHQIALSNRGNARLVPLLGATDPDEVLAFALPSEIEVEPGTAAFTRMKVRPRKRFLWGQPQAHPFTVVAEAAGQAPVTVNGNMIQEPIVPRWLPKALLALAALALVWFFLLRPTVESAARDAVKDDVTRLQNTVQVQGQDDAATAAEVDAQGGKLQELEQQIQVLTQEPSPRPPAPPPATLGTPTDGFLALEASGPGATVTDSFEVPAKRKLSVTDLLFQNPNGDTGTLTIQRVSADGATVTTLMRQALENFRQLDLHFVAPLVFEAGQEVRIVVACDNPPPEDQPNEPAPACSDAVYFSGFLKKV